MATLPNFGGYFIIKTNGGSNPPVNGPVILNPDPTPVFITNGSGSNSVNIPLPSQPNPNRMIIACVHCCGQFVGDIKLDMSYGGQPMIVRQLNRAPTSQFGSVDMGISAVGILYLGNTTPVTNEFNVGYDTNSYIAYNFDIAAQIFVLGDVDPIDGSGEFNFGRVFETGTGATINMEPMPLGTVIFSFGTSSAVPALGGTFTYNPPTGATVVPSNFASNTFTVVGNRQSYAGSVAFKNVTNTETAGTASTWTKTGDDGDPNPGNNFNGPFYFQKPGVSNISLALRIVGGASPIQFWNRVDNGTITDEIRSMSKFGSQYVAGTADGLYYSSNLISWIGAQHPTFNGLVKIAQEPFNGFNTPKLVAVISDPTVKLVMSTDGVIWSDVTPSGTGSALFIDVEFANGYWLATGANGMVYYSFDAETWTQAGWNGSSSTAAGRKIAYNNTAGRFFILAGNGQVWNTSSPDTWTVQTLPGAGSFDTFLQATTLPNEFSGNNFVVIGQKSDGSKFGTLGTLIYRWNNGFPGAFEDISNNVLGYVPGVNFYSPNAVRFGSSVIAGPDVFGTAAVTQITGTGPFTFTPYSMPAELTTMNNIALATDRVYTVGDAIVSTLNGTTYTTELAQSGNIYPNFVNVLADGFTYIAYGSVFNSGTNTTTGAIYTRQV